MIVLTMLLGGIAALSLAAHLGSNLLAIVRPFVMLLRPRRQPHGAPAFRPHLTLIRPVKGLDPYDRVTLASSFEQVYPDYEILFCVEDPQDPACAQIRALIEANPQVPAQLLVGQSQISGNPKLNNVEKGCEAARGDWFVLADSNLMLGPDYLSTLADSWDPGTGLVSGPPLGAVPANFWGAVECAFLNGNQARWQLAADVLGLGFAQGKTLFWNRRILNAGGGLPALGRDTAEDVGSTKLVRGQGLRVRLPRRLSLHPVGRRSPRAVWDRQLRWSIIRREGFPVIFALECLQGPVPGLLALILMTLIGNLPAFVPAVAPVLYMGVWYGAEALFARVYGIPLTPRDLAAMIVRDAMLAGLWGVSLFRRGFDWRGTAMTAEAVR